MAGTLLKTDARIQEEVLRELRWDTRVKETEIGVQVDSGVVTLTGAVTSYGEKIAAQEAAHRVRGVLDVANDIQVKLNGGAPDDSDVAHAVRHALEWNLLIPDKRIQTTVSDGIVTLEGDVDSVFERKESEKVIQHLHGVRGVRNHIVVRPSEVDPNTVRITIEEALERRAEREAERIDISVNDGTVIVTGRVNSWRDKRAVLGAISHAPGVHSVEDHLRIDPYA